ncbi:MAG TPA: lysophospholipid acyltransferase family protein [Rhodopila sp.]|jgi:1-acyl-sn-glycerol-3-phosphate acyltransferase|nr:lysophospholipid acyltransferase family protein [Rhodopila sp.]
MTLLRSTLYNVFFFSLTFILVWPAVLISLVSRRALIGLVRLWARLLVAGARAICGIRLNVTGLEHLPRGAALIASAHQSAFDTFVWFTLVPDCCYVLKLELTRIPLFGRLIYVGGQIPVDRDAGGTAIRSLVRGGSQALQQGRQVVIFPEGTRSEPGTVGALQPGIAALAARTGQPVIPVATNSGLCWSRKAFVKRAGVITIAIGAPIPPDVRREELMERLRDAFAALHAKEAQPGAD